MPEGPEIRREALALAGALVGRPLVRAEYRLPRLARRARGLAGTTIVAVESRGKALLIAFANGVTHYSHNQLYGAWELRRADRAEPAPGGRAVRVVLATDRHVATLYSATEIALLDARGVAAHPFLARLGPDVFAPATTAAFVAARLAAPAFARRSLASLLLDQRFVAGLGNYLRSDILHAARLSHALRPADLTAGETGALARAIVALPRRSLRTGGVTNEPERARALAAAGATHAQRRFLAYDRAGAPCYGCGTAIRRVDVGGRGVFFCPRCQRAR
jgi:endonuclease-8